MSQGIVVKNTGSWYIVRTDDGKDINCKIKGNFRLKGIRSTNPVAVGDRVDIVENNEGSALICNIQERKNYIIRKSPNLSKESHILAANIDICLLFVTIRNPETSTVFIDRFLASAQAYNVPVVLVFNKSDIFTPDDLDYVEALSSLYQHIGYKCIKISVLTGQGINEVIDLVQGKIALFSGHSGVGKSSLINKLVPGVHLKTGEISASHSKGMHTTTFSEMVETPGGGFLIDTPGIKGFGTVNMDKANIAHYFPDIFAFSEKCKFNNCLHLNEPGCAVVDAVNHNFISESRYKSYLSMMDEESDNKYRK